MRAFQIEGPGVVREISVPVPQIESDEALIRIIYAGVCATDYEILGGEMELVKNGSIRYPVRFGHEYSAVVEKVGSDVKKFKPGDRVLSDPGVTCGKCEACREGRWQDCENARSVGTVNCWDGCFAEYMRVPERHLHRLPDDIDMVEAALIEPSGIALEGLKRGGDLRGKTILISGTGAIGMTAVAMAGHFKPAKIILAGRTDAKLAIGRELGAGAVVNVRNENLQERVLAETGGRGVDLAIETSGNPEAVNGCVHALRYGGTASFIGFYDRPAKDFPIDEVVSRKLTVGGVMGDYGTPGQVIEILKSDRIRLRPIVTHMIGMNELTDAMIHPERLPGERIKVMVKIGEE